MLFVNGKKLETRMSTVKSGFERAEAEVQVQFLCHPRRYLL